ncbi:hypothetical protein Tco_0292942, partial [Tanacetum coccineum]
MDKHEHGNQKCTKEAKDSKPKPRKVNYGQASVKESQTLVNRSQPLEDKNGQTRTRESEVHKRSQGFKAEAKKSQLW